MSQAVSLVRLRRRKPAAFFSPGSAEACSREYPDQKPNFQRNRRSYLWITKALYQSKLTTPEEAVKCVHDGDWVAWGWVTNTPKACDHAMAEHLKTLHDVQFRGGILMWKPEMFDMPDAKDHFTWNSWHMSGIERKMIDRGFCFYSPVRYSEVPKYCRETANPERVFFVQCSPMDKHGYFNFGPNASHLIEIADRAEEIIVEVNPNMPRCLGGYHTDIHVSQVTKIIETNNSMAAMPPAAHPLRWSSPSQSMLCP